MKAKPLHTTHAPIPDKLKNSDSELVHQEGLRQDVGFGTRFTDPYSRLINKDGSFNINRINESFWDRLNLYNRLITMNWVYFLGWILLFYLAENILFAAIYVMAGAENLVGTNDVMFHGAFWKAFFFSAQTLTTVGYGHIVPNSFLTSAIAAFESMLGLLAFALSTGLLYGRFSRPVAHIRFSKQAVVAPYLDVNGWMFRIINERSNQLIDVQVEVSLSRLETRPDGTSYRRYYRLSLERTQVTFFPNNWTLVHPITSESPLYGYTDGDLSRSDAEFLILVRATDDTFAQVVHCRYSYRYDEIQWSRKFGIMTNENQAGKISVDLNKLDNTEPATLN